MKLDTLQPEFVPWKLKTRDLLDNEINHVHTNLRLDKNGQINRIYSLSHLCFLFHFLTRSEKLIIFIALNFISTVVLSHWKLPLDLKGTSLSTLLSPKFFYALFICWRMSLFSLESPYQQRYQTSSSPRRRFFFNRWFYLSKKANCSK